MPITDFVVQTCEARAMSEKKIPFIPASQSRQKPFEIGDPFGLRKAILPIFERTPSGDLIGMGTATHTDGWGSFITAEHVIDFLRASLPQGGLTGEQTQKLDPKKQSHAIALLGMGLVFGEVRVPDWAFAPITKTLAVTCAVDDPIAELQGRQRFEMALDIAGFQADIPTTAYDKADAPQTLPFQLHGWTPTVGEHVLAFGYPELKPKAIVSDNSLQLLIEDGLFGAYGKITRVFASGRDRANQTPVFEVEAHWPSGMSGGPVVNEAGNVVGVVSRSLAPDGDLPGVGYAACLPWIDEVEKLVPSIDSLNPGFRIGFGVFCEKSQRFLGVWQSRQLAIENAAGIKTKNTVLACSQRIGTDEYVRLE